MQVLCQVRCVWWARGTSVRAGDTDNGGASLRRDSLLNCSAIQSHCGAMRASSSSSPVCSLNNTLPRSALAWWTAKPPTKAKVPPNSHDLEAAQVCPFDQESEDAFDICDILTSGGRPAPSKAHEESLDCAHELDAHGPSWGRQHA